MSHLATIGIRSGSTSDLDALLNIDPLARSQVQRADLLRESLALEQGVIASTGDEVAGFAILNYTFFHFGFIPLIVVAPAHRRSGIGLRLLEAAERRCTSTKLFSSTNSSNAVARRLFVRAGFIESGRIENVDPNDPEIIYFKPIVGPTYER